MNNIERYKLFIQNLDWVPLFLQDWWLDTVYGKDQWDAVFSQKDGTDYDALPYFVENKYGFKLIRPAKLLPYASNIRIQDHQSLLALWKKLPSTSQSIITTFPGQLFQSTPDMETQPNPTYRIQLTDHSESTLLSICTKERQRHIKTANKQLEYREDTFNTDEFISWHRSSFTQKGKSYPYHQGYIENLLQKAKENNAVHTLTALLDGQSIAHIACFYDSRFMYYLLGAKDSKYNKYNALSGLLFSCILKAKEMNLHCFDFEGSKDPGIALFFSKFGAEQAHYYTISSRASLAWKILQRLRNN